MGLYYIMFYSFRNLKAEDIIVRCGDFNTEVITEALEFQERDIKHVSIHPAYNDGGSNVQNLHFDFALLHAVSDFGTDDVHIFPICLPEGLVPNYSGDLCYVMGYGKDKIGKCFDLLSHFTTFYVS